MKVPNTPKMDLYPNYGLSYTPFWKTTWFISIVLAIVCFIVGYVIYVYWKRKRAVQKVYTPDEIALDQLSKLEQEIQTHQITSQQCYTRLTQVLKLYLHARFGFHLFDKTDDEIASFLLINGQGITIQPIASIFEQAQSFKFSPDHVSDQEMLTAIELARTFVIQHRQVSTPQA